MAKLVNQHQKSLKKLEKTLEDIDTKRRRSEANIEKELHDLSLDLSRLQKTSRDLNALPDTARRGSLPHINGDTSIRSQRTVGKNSISSFTHEPRRSTGNAKVGDGSGAKMNPPVQENRNNSKTYTDSRKTASETAQGSNKKTGGHAEAAVENGTPVSPMSLDLYKLDDINLPELIEAPRRNAHQPATVVFNLEPEVLDHEQSRNVSESDDIITEEEEQRRRLRFSRLQSRRASEPGISQHHLKALHSGASVKQSIKSHLPSDMVAEEDEEIGDEQKEDAVTPAGKAVKKVPVGQGYADQRRKSDGDILKSVQQWRALMENNKAKVGGGNANRQTNPRSDEVWRSVRKCRYIRGYDPPEMILPKDVNKFVFDRKK